MFPYETSFRKIINGSTQSQVKKLFIKNIEIRYPPYNHGKIKLMNLLSKNSSISTGDLIKKAQIALIVVILTVYIRKNKDFFLNRFYKVLSAIIKMKATYLSK